MDTIFISPVIVKLFLFTLCISSFFAGLILSASISRAGRGCILYLAAFIMGVCIHVGCMYVSIRYFNAFGQHVFLIQLISLGIISAIGGAVYKILVEFHS